MARYIHETVTVKTGNYLVFAPSYQVMEQVADRCVAYEDMECIRQESGMTEEEREAFLKEFEKERNHSLVGFCVMGGIFSCLLYTSGRSYECESGAAHGGGAESTGTSEEACRYAGTDPAGTDHADG